MNRREQVAIERVRIETAIVDHANMLALVTGPHILALQDRLGLSDSDCHIRLQWNPTKSVLDAPKFYQDLTIPTSDQALRQIEAAFTYEPEVTLCFEWNDWGNKYSYRHISFSMVPFIYVVARDRSNGWDCSSSMEYSGHTVRHKLIVGFPNFFGLFLGGYIPSDLSQVGFRGEWRMKNLTIQEMKLLLPRDISKSSSANIGLEFAIEKYMLPWVIEHPTAPPSGPFESVDGNRIISKSHLKGWIDSLGRPDQNNPSNCNFLPDMI